MVIFFNKIATLNLPLAEGSFICKLGNYSSIAEQAGLIILGQGAGTVAKKTIPGLKRPTASASKDHILTKDFRTYERDVAFRKGEKVDYYNSNKQRAGSDAYIEGHAVDVKNYDLSNVENHKRLKEDIIEDYFRRKKHFPEGTKQTVVIDARRQTQLSQAEEDALKAEIYQKTGATENELIIKFEFK